MVFQYKRVLLVGATAGIGAAMADKLIHEGAKVIAVGRRQDRLDAFVQKHGQNRAAAIRFDITDKAGLDAFVKGVVEKYPDLDCVFLNSGVQSVARMSKPDEMDLDAFHREVDVNFTSMVNLCIKFLSHLLKQSSPAGMVLTGTHLSVVPAVTMPAYSSSKAAIRAFFDCLRRQNQGSNVTFIEISPPVVQTELHDYIGAERGRAMGMPVNDFVDATYTELAKGREQIVIGKPGTASKEEYEALLSGRQKMFDNLSDLMMAHF